MSGKTTAGEPDRQGRVHRFASSMGIPEILILAVSIVAPIWAWHVDVVTAPQQFGQFATAYLVCVGGGAFLQFVLAWYIRPRGTWRQRLTLQTDKRGVAVVCALPVAAFAVVALLTTPPSTSGDQFEAGMSIYAVIGIMAFVGLIVILVCTLLVLALVGLPLAMLTTATEKRTPAMEPAGAASRTELVCGALIIFVAVVFGVSMTLMGGDAGATSGWQKMGMQFGTFVTLNGAPVPTLLAGLSILALIALVIVHNRAGSRRRKDMAARVAALSDDGGLAR